MAKLRVRLIVWDPKEASARSSALRQAGFAVDAHIPQPPTLLRELAARPVNAIAIDLVRVPSQGRDLAISLPQRRGTRAIPIVFVGGDAGKVDCIRTLLPDAAYTTWRGLPAALKRAAAHPPEHPVVHRLVFAAYAGTPLVRKLGIRPGMRVCLLRPPTRFRSAMGDSPDGVHLKSGSCCRPDMIIWFGRTEAELRSGMESTARRSVGGPVWIAWPKEGSSVKSDLTQQDVRREGLASRLVDYKICSIDATWSGLLIRQRRARSGRKSRPQA
jgi:hypothetical protein